MKWITHQTGAVIGALALALPLPAVIASAFGAVAPDVIDQQISGLASTRKKKQKLFNRLHRGASHWFGWWLGLLLISFALPWPPLLRDVAIGLALGVLSHVMLDLLTPRGVPLLPFTQKFRVAVPVCSTGKPGEYLFLFAMLAIGWFCLQDSLLHAIQALPGYFQQ